MTIAGAVDMVMDALATADPQAAVDMRARIAGLAADRAAEAGGFSVEAGAGATRQAEAPRAAFEKFEAFVLQTFIQSMLPDDTESVYGKGLSGDMWKSMLAEQLAGNIAASGGIGIADRILADSVRDGDKAVPLAGVSAPAAGAEAQSRSLAALSLIQQMERRVAAGLETEPPATGLFAS